MPILEELDVFYRDNGIHPLEFRCPHRSSCSADCQNFTEARASLVGDLYGDPIRVVVLSLDPGSAKPDASDRTLEALAERHRRTDPASLHKHKHWYRTHETVAALLSHLTGRKLEVLDIKGRFAHVNAAKCSLNLPHNKQAPKHLFDNCRPYLEHELSILAPDIVITQGKRAAKVVKQWKTKTRWKNVIELGDRTFYWLELTHPTAWGGAYVAEQKKWGRRFEHVRRWLESQPERLTDGWQIAPPPSEKEVAPAACPFCNDIEKRVLIERKHIRILWDGFPLSPGHALIVPKRHIATWQDATPPERRALMRGIALAQDAIEQQHAPDGYNIGINDGAAAGQTVPHLHVHVIPRYAGDVADPRGGVRWVIPNRADYWTERER